MLIKEERGRINFIDDNDNFVGFDFESCCCENFGWHAATELTAIAPDKEPSLDGFRFDTSIEPLDVDSSDDEEAVVAFKCVNDAGDVVYLHLSNSHNGYYSHGWDASWGPEGSL